MLKKGDAFLLLKPSMTHPHLFWEVYTVEISWSKKAPEYLATDITVNMLLIVVYIQYKSKDDRNDKGLLDKP